jgi:hypothetical protein
LYIPEVSFLRQFSLVYIGQVFDNLRIGLLDLPDFPEIKFLILRHFHRENFRNLKGLQIGITEKPSSDHSGSAL